MPSGTLYVVATPIGNLDDFSRRAASILGRVARIVCEDTRQTRKLLERYGIRRPLDAYHDFNETAKADALYNRLVSGEDLALVSDSGTPGISDPGYRLVRLCRQRNLAVIPVPGPAAAVSALSVSGLPSDEFLFVGFLPARSGARRRKLESLQTVPSTLVFYEAPRRLVDTLRDMLAVFGNREVFIAREMTKLHEEYTFGRLDEAPMRVRAQGEAVIVLEGARQGSAEPPVTITGRSRQELLKLAADRLGVTRRALYEALFRDGPSKDDDSAGPE